MQHVRLYCRVVMQVLSRMSAEEVSDALSTLQARLPAKTLAFLKARGAKKAGVLTSTVTHACIEIPPGDSWLEPWLVLSG